jgi:hypothetical protein
MTADFTDMVQALKKKWRCSTNSDSLTQISPLNAMIGYPYVSKIQALTMHMVFGINIFMM